MGFLPNLLFHQESIAVYPPSYNGLISTQHQLREALQFSLWGVWGTSGSIRGVFSLLSSSLVTQPYMSLVLSVGRPPHTLQKNQIDFMPIFLLQYP
mmetsp:Transcript_3946/g.8884  ORF Transcript_3946/g.8884 Transcript_3946/m.8884 type:complete len:96 (-) Transcript_3946:468-755(-)